MMFGHCDLDYEDRCVDALKAKRREWAAWEQEQHEFKKWFTERYQPLLQRDTEIRMFFKSVKSALSNTQTDIKAINCALDYVEGAAATIPDNGPEFESSLMWAKAVYTLAREAV